MVVPEMIDVPEWAANALMAVSEGRTRSKKQAPLNKETEYLLRWLDDAAVLRRVRNLMVETRGRVETKFGPLMSRYQ